MGDQNLFRTAVNTMPLSGQLRKFLAKSCQSLGGAVLQNLIGSLDKLISYNAEYLFAGKDGRNGPAAGQ